MNHLIRIYSRRVFHLQIDLILLPTVLLFFVLTAQAQTDVRLPAIGGSGGSEFVARCPEGKLLTGFELHAGDWVDSIRPLCVTDYGLYDVTTPEPYPSKFGGDTGTPLPLLCTDHYDKGITIPLAPIVLGMYVGSEGRQTITVNRIHLICGVADPDESAGLDNIRKQLEYNRSDPPRVRFDGITHYEGPESEQACPAGLVAVGIHGRSGVWLDAVGLICGAPKIAPEPTINLGNWGGNASQPPIALGRVPSTSPPGPAKSICEHAQDARARNSPAAPALEAQCHASRDKIEPVAVGRVKGMTADTSRPICEVARDARARNSPAAPGLESQCRTYLATKGAAIAQTDTELTEARAIGDDASYQQGFDIATAIFGDPAKGAQGNTALGPGSLNIRGALGAVGQKGFDASVKIHLSRKYQ